MDQTPELSVESQSNLSEGRLDITCAELHRYLLVEVEQFGSDEIPSVGVYGVIKGQVDWGSDGLPM